MQYLFGSVFDSVFGAPGKRGRPPGPRPTAKPLPSKAKPLPSKKLAARKAQATRAELAVKASEKEFLTLPTTSWIQEEGSEKIEAAKQRWAARRQGAQGYDAIMLQELANLRTLDPAVFDVLDVRTIEAAAQRGANVAQQKRLSSEDAAKQIRGELTAALQTALSVQAYRDVAENEIENLPDALKNEINASKTLPASVRDVAERAARKAQLENLPRLPSSVESILILPKGTVSRPLTAGQYINNAIYKQLIDLGITANYGAVVNQELSKIKNESAKLARVLQKSGLWPDVEQVANRAIVEARNKNLSKKEAGAYVKNAIRADLKAIGIGQKGGVPTERLTTLPEYFEEFDQEYEDLPEEYAGELPMPAAEEEQIVASEEAEEEAEIEAEIERLRSETPEEKEKRRAKQAKEAAEAEGEYTPDPKRIPNAVKKQIAKKRIAIGRAFKDRFAALSHTATGYQAIMLRELLNIPSSKVSDWAEIEAVAEHAASMAQQKNLNKNETVELIRESLKAIGRQADPLEKYAWTEHKVAPDPAKFKFKEDVGDWGVWLEEQDAWFERAKGRGAPLAVTVVGGGIPVRPKSGAMRPEESPAYQPKSEPPDPFTWMYTPLRFRALQPRDPYEARTQRISEFKIIDQLVVDVKETEKQLKEVRGKIAVVQKQQKEMRAKRILTERMKDDLAALQRQYQDYGSRAVKLTEKIQKLREIITGGRGSIVTTKCSPNFIEKYEIEVPDYGQYDPMFGRKIKTENISKLVSGLIQLARDFEGVHVTFGKDYVMFRDADDAHKLKSYLEAQASNLEPPEVEEVKRFVESMINVGSTPSKTKILHIPEKKRKNKKTKKVEVIPAHDVKVIIPVARGTKKLTVVSCGLVEDAWAESNPPIVIARNPDGSIKRDENGFTVYEQRLPKIITRPQTKIFDVNPEEDESTLSAKQREARKRQAAEAYEEGWLSTEEAQDIELPPDIKGLSDAVYSRKGLYFGIAAGFLTAALTIGILRLKGLFARQ